MAARLMAVALLLIIHPALSSAQGSPRATGHDTIVPMRIQSFSVIVRDYDEAKAFYTQRLGFAVVRDMSFGASGERFLEVAPPGQKDFGIVLQRAQSMPNAKEPEMTADYSDRIGKQVNIVLQVREPRAYADSLTSHGVELTSPLRSMAWGTQFTFRDLYGNTFVALGPREAVTSNGHPDQ
jgi:predicted enzyme related to lactoylglutathione lyase